MLRNKTSTIIHTAGLSIGFISTLLILFYVQFERSYEEMHRNGENIYRISLDLYNGSEFIENDTETYQTLGPEFKQTMPEVLDYARFFNQESSEMKAVSTNIKSYENKIYYTDPSAFSIFSYAFLDDSNIKKFEEPFAIVISRKTALKYFGKTDVIGETMLFSFLNNPLEIVAVMEDLPQNTHLKFDVLVSHATLPVVSPWYKDNLWNANNEYTYLLVSPGTDLNSFNQKLEKYSSENEQLKNKIVIAEKITDIHLNSNKTFEPEVNGSAETVNFMLAVGVLVLILAWINYINLSTAKAMERAKEVGIRKTVGSTKSQLVAQFFCEAFLTNLFSAAISVLIFFMVLPYYKDFAGLDLGIEQFGQLRMLRYVTGFVLIGTIVSGFYPAMVLSNFSPVSVLKGKFSNSNKGIVLRKGLVFMQFIASVVLLCVSLAVFKQMQFLTSRDLGVSIDNTLVIKLPQTSLSDSLRVALSSTFTSQLSQESWIKGIANADAVPGSDVHELSTNNSVRRVGEDEKSGSFNYYHYAVSPNYPDLMGIKLIEGPYCWNPGSLQPTGLHSKQGTRL